MMQLPTELQRFVASTIKLIVLTAAVAAICWIAYGLWPAVRIFMGVAGIIMLAQVWAYRKDIADYFSDAPRR
jgi:hypothetical protein